jgi:hypothetical protein
VATAQLEEVAEPQGADGDGGVAVAGHDAPAAHAGVDGGGFVDRDRVVGQVVEQRHLAHAQGLGGRLGDALGEVAVEAQDLAVERVPPGESAQNGLLGRRRRLAGARLEAEGAGDGLTLHRLYCSDALGERQAASLPVGHGLVQRGEVIPRDLGQRGVDAVHCHGHLSGTGARSPTITIDTLRSERCERASGRHHLRKEKACENADCLCSRVHG